MTKRIQPHAPEVRERAVRMVLDHQGERGSQWAAIQSIAAKIGCSGEALRNWVRQSERDRGQRAGPMRAVALLRRGRVRHARMGRLVQHPPPARTDRPHPSRRGGGALLCPDRGASLGRLTQPKRPPRNPGRFNFVLEDARRGVVGIEVKAAATVWDSDFKGLRRLQAHLGDRFRLGVVLYDGSRLLPFGDRMVAAPLSALWQ